MFDDDELETIEDAPIEAITDDQLPDDDEELAFPPPEV
jgi:hypothetical protein